MHPVAWVGLFYANCIFRCCACPETKSARDSCFLQYGADQGQCAELIRKHVECMRGLGFEI